MMMVVVVVVVMCTLDCFSSKQQIACTAKALIKLLVGCDRVNDDDDDDGFFLSHSLAKLPSPFPSSSSPCRMMQS